jgi:hypothetical protein
MRRTLAFAAALLVISSASAQDDIVELYGCTLATATYRQPTTEWVLQFRPLTQDDAINQRNAFTLTMPDGKVIEGGIYMPNGFTTAYGSMDLDCPAEFQNMGDPPPEHPGCNLWDGTVYGDGPRGIGELVDEKAVPPLQVLFPQFAASLWYSYVPGMDMREYIPLDAFTFAGCAK